MKSFLAFTQFHRRGDTILRDPVEWDPYISLLDLWWWRWSFKISSFDQVRDYCQQCRDWLQFVIWRLIIFKCWPKCLELVGSPHVYFAHAFHLQVLSMLGGVMVYPLSVCQPLKLLGKVTNCECKWDKSRMQFCRCLPIFARIYAQAPTAVAGNKLTLELNSIEQDSAVAKLSRIWINFQTFLFS